MTPEQPTGGLGLWLVGAKGAISSCVVYGLAGLARGWVEPLGVVTAGDAFRGLELAPFDRFVTGGWDVSARPMSDTVASLVNEGVLDGALVHSDSMGNRHEVRPGEIQLMRAGSGVRHSEMNASKTDPVHFLQIWVVPAHTGRPPGYAQQSLDADALRGGFEEIAGPDHAVQIDQDARLLAAWPQAGDTHQVALDAGRQYYLHLADGRLAANGQPMAAGDALIITGETALEVLAESDSQVLLFDLRPEEAH